MTPEGAAAQSTAESTGQSTGEPTGRSTGLWGDRRAWAGFAVAVGIVLFARFAWSVPSGVIAQGALVGGLTSLLALGIALVYRANRIVNFAAGDLGLVPATFAILLMIGSARFGWWPALFVGLATAVALGALVEVGIIRRFSRVAAPDPHGRDDRPGAAPRGSFVEASRHGSCRPAGAVPEPFDVHLTISPITFKGTDVVAFVVVPLAFVALAVFLRGDGRGHRDPRRRRRDRARRRAGHPGPKSPDARLGDRERARVRRRVPPRRHRRAAARRGARAGDPAPRARGSGRRSDGAAADDRGRGDRARHRRAGRHLALERAGLRRPGALRRRGRRARS